MATRVGIKPHPFCMSNFKKEVQEMTKSQNNNLDIEFAQEGGVQEQNQKRQKAQKQGRKRKNEPKNAKESNEQS